MQNQARHKKEGGEKEVSTPANFTTAMWILQDVQTTFTLRKAYDCIHDVNGTK
jgi:hypothetical protein